MDSRDKAILLYIKTINLHNIELHEKQMIFLEKIWEYFNIISSTFRDKKQPSHPI